ncbi:MAG: hypothetical protein R3B45_09600 [Bdellovibrionota bacterium]
MRQPSLFDSNANESMLPVISSIDRILTKEQRQFNDKVKKIEVLKARNEKLKRQLLDIQSRVIDTLFSIEE